MSTKSVADGEMAVGLTLWRSYVKLLNDGVDVKSHLSKEGTVLPGNAAIIKNAKHMENAKNLSISFFLKHSG